MIWGKNILKNMPSRNLTLETSFDIWTEILLQTLFSTIWMCFSPITFEGVLFFLLFLTP